MNHILQFTDEATAQAALTQLYVLDDGGWREDKCIPNVRVYQITGTHQETDADGNTYTVEDRIYQAGWFICVCIDTGITPFNMTGFISTPVFAS